MNIKNKNNKSFLCCHKRHLNPMNKNAQKKSKSD